MHGTLDAFVTEKTCRKPQPNLGLAGKECLDDVKLLI